MIPAISDVRPRPCPGSGVGGTEQVCARVHEGRAQACRCHDGLLCGEARSGVKILSRSESISRSGQSLLFVCGLCLRRAAGQAAATSACGV